MTTSIQTLVGARTATIVDGIAWTPPPVTFERYTLLDRGSYEHAAVDVPASIVDRASAIAGRTLTVERARLLRLLPGDYLLAHHDRVYDGFPIEICLDLSPREVPGAEVHYRRRGQVFFQFPSTPGAMAVVERGPTVTCNHTYVSKRHPPDTEVVRLVAVLR